MRILIQQIDSSSEMKFIVKIGEETSTPMMIPNPAEYPVIGYPNLRLLPQLKWYLESFLEYPTGPNVEKAEAIVFTLESWGSVAFNRLFSKNTQKWLENSEIQWDSLNICVISDSPAVLSWPWEALYSNKLGYLARHCSIERFLPDMKADYKESLPAVEELHLLFIISRPKGVETADFHALTQEVLKHIQKERLPVKVDVLRPPTFDNLNQTLRKRPGYYHMIHFDGHGGLRFGSWPSAEGILLFENEDGTVDSIGAKELGDVLAHYQIPLMTLNACQSAMMGENATDPFASVAASLLKAGIRSVVAMGYSLCVSSAKLFVPAFYARLFQDGNVAGAMLNGRRMMYRNPVRRGIFGEYAFQDWVVPQLYQVASFDSGVLPPLHYSETPVEEESSLLPDEANALGDCGFIGRRETIWELEQAVQREKKAGIIIYGMAGMGKTTLVKGFLNWLRDTGGLKDENSVPYPVFWFDFHAGLGVDYITNKLFDSLLKEKSGDVSMTDKRKVLISYLYHNRAYIVWDNFESVIGMSETGSNLRIMEDGRAQLRDFLKSLYGGLTKVLIISQTAELGLDEECAHMKMPLLGLNSEDLWLYCEAVGRIIGVSPPLNHESFIGLVRKLDGNPLAVRSLLLRMKDCPVERLSQELDGIAGIADSSAGSNSLFMMFHILCQNIDKDFFPVLRVLGLFEHYADVDNVASVLINLCAENNNFQPPKPSDIEYFKNIARRCFRFLENAGLCAHIYSRQYQLHPFLRAFLSREFPANTREQVMFVRTFAAMAKIIRLDDYAQGLLLKLQEENFIHAKELGRRFERLEDVFPLLIILERIANVDNNLELEERVSLEYVDLWKQSGQEPTALHEIYDRLAGIAYSRGDWEKSREWTRKAVLLLRESEGTDAEVYYHKAYDAERRGDLQTALANYQKAFHLYRNKENWHKANRMCLYAGGIAERQNQTAIAESWIQKGLQIAPMSEMRQGDEAMLHQEYGVILMKKNRFQEAEIYLLLAASALLDTGNMYQYAITCGLLGTCCAKLQRNDDGKNYLFQALRIYKQLDIKSQVVAMCLNVLGEIAESEGDSPSAEKWFLAALSIAEEYGEEEPISAIRNNLARLSDGE